MNLNGMHAHLVTIKVNQDEIAVWNEDFPSKHFVRSFNSLKAKKRVAPYANFEFKGMLICASKQDSNGMILILAHALVPRKDEESWLYFSDSFEMSYRQLFPISLILNACVTCQKKIK